MPGKERRRNVGERLGQPDQSERQRIVGVEVHLPRDNDALDLNPERRGEMGRRGGKKGREGSSVVGFNRAGVLVSNEGWCWLFLRRSPHCARNGY